jgi:hypothetical protein
LDELQTQSERPGGEIIPDLTGTQINIKEQIKKTGKETRRKEIMKEQKNDKEIVAD